MYMYMYACQALPAVPCNRSWTVNPTLICPVTACAGVIRGAFQLHPSTQPRNFPVCLINFALPADQLLRHLHSVAEWQQVPVLTDADITARATQLGLLPAKTLEARGGCTCAAAV
jgi:hypothetical protein